MFRSTPSKSTRYSNFRSELREKAFAGFDSLCSKAKSEIRFVNMRKKMKSSNDKAPMRRVFLFCLLQSTEWELAQPDVEEGKMHQEDASSYAASLRKGQGLQDDMSGTGLLWISVQPGISNDFRSECLSFFCFQKDSVRLNSERCIQHHVRACGSHNTRQSIRMQRYVYLCSSTENWIK